MSGAEKSAGKSGEAAAGSGDPSMEDILASIRRILSEDEAPAAAGVHPVPEPTANSDVLVLDPAMMVNEPVPPLTEPLAEQPPPPAASTAVPAMASTMVAPETAAAAATSVNDMVRRLAAERTMQIRSNGPTIEDIVREELRPLLKAWLDANLPPLVERLVRAEIERVVGRAVP